MLTVEWHNARGGADLVTDRATGLLTDAESDLYTLAILSLFTVAPHPEGPTRSHGRGGWWGDIYSAEPWGSLLWTLELDGRLGPDSAELAEQYAEQALRWLVRDRHASDLTVEAAILPGRLDISVRLMHAPTRGIDIGPWSLGPRPTDVTVGALPSTTAGLPRVIPVRL